MMRLCREIQQAAVQIPCIIVLRNRNEWIL